MFERTVQQMKDAVALPGVRELRTPADVDDLILRSSGTVLIFINSACGCAGGIARPALGLAMTQGIRPDWIATVFATTDREATYRVRSHCAGMPPSSPSFVLLRNGMFLGMIHRSDIEGREPGEVAGLLMQLIERHRSLP